MNLPQKAIIRPFKELYQFVEKNKIIKIPTQREHPTKQQKFHNLILVTEPYHPN